MDPDKAAQWRAGGASSVEVAERHVRADEAGAAGRRDQQDAAPPRIDAPRPAAGSTPLPDGDARSGSTGQPATAATDPSFSAGLHADGKRRRRRRRGARKKEASAQQGHGGDEGASTNPRRPMTGSSAAEAPARMSGALAENRQLPGNQRPKPHRSKARRRARRQKEAVASALQPSPDRTGSSSDVSLESARTRDIPAPQKAKAPHDGAASAENTRRRSVDTAPARRNHSASPHLYAALDLGTNNCRLLVAAPTRPGQFRVVDAFSRIVRLGEGLAASGRLSDAAMDRAIEALRICAHKLGDRPVRRARLIATEACRAADNGMEFLERVRGETGLELEVVDREAEARLAVSGCASLIERETDSVVLFDIGGGSSEIAVIDLSENRTNRLANHIRAWTSLPVGVVTLSERFGGRDVTPELFEAMVADVQTMLQSFLAPILPGMGEKDGRFHLIGTSGTVTTLAGVHLDLPRYDRRRVDGLWLTSGEVDRMLERILSWDFAARSANPCIGSDRADLVLAGCAIMEGIRRRWPSERLRVADRGLREGLLTDMMAADGVWRRRRSRFPGADRRPRPEGGKPS